ncbi:hypothetical protein RI054_15g71570 [Pseudoscourfieldia marina]
MYVARTCTCTLTTTSRAAFEAASMFNSNGSTSRVPALFRCGRSFAASALEKKAQSTAAAGTSAPFGGNVYVPIAVGDLPTQIACGMACASFWRGAWYIMDDKVFPGDALKSGSATLAAGVGLFAAVQRAAGSAACTAAARGWTMPAHMRHGLMYAYALACVAVWRGTWVLWDAATGVDVAPAVMCHAAGIAVLLSRGRLSCALAPPASPAMLQDSDVVRQATHLLPSFLAKARVLVRAGSFRRS